MKINIAGRGYAMLNNTLLTHDTLLIFNHFLVIHGYKKDVFHLVANELCINCIFCSG